MPDINAYCFKCRAKRKVNHPIKVKWSNRNSNTGTIEAWKGQCDSCGKTIYKIIGKG